MKLRKKKHVLIIPDGGGDTARFDGRSPLALAETPYTDFMARAGVSGRMQTLYADLPKESIVAQLGMFGWDPREYYPDGRASCELLALEGIRLEEGDLAFRANLVRMAGRQLASYNADYIYSEQARPIIDMLNEALKESFPEFKLFHNSDFRNTLIFRGIQLDPKALRCPEPHESHGVEFDVNALITASEPRGQAAAARINQYLARVAELLRDEQANMIFPWSPSKVLRLPAFSEHTGFAGKVALVGCMDFLHGIAKAGALESFKVGNGRPDTDYAAKGAKVVELLTQGYEFVICHVNAPDEASHMGDLAGKIKALEMIDAHVVRPVVEYFQRNEAELGGVMLVPDHYTNHAAVAANSKRIEIHSIHAVPFVLWNGHERDE
ncbi:MAG TPA: hypothetical protein VE775_07865, partial [Pyrinomonadaceae bacterium]|nr:hypothetical protein [Pyrinomonadaceae bacterium]